MKIYISHSRDFDFQNDLYQPLLESKLSKDHTLILPHLQSSSIFDSKSLIRNHDCDLVLAEVSFSSTGQGIELGWADDAKVPVACFYRAGAKVSGSLQAVTETFIEYKDQSDMINQLRKYLKRHE